MHAREGTNTVRRLCAMFALAVLSVGAFLPVLGNGFILDYDDWTNLGDNPYFRGLGPTEIAWAWRSTRLGVYQPFGWMLFSAEYELWGLAPWGYHLVSVACHAANACLVYLLIDRLLALSRPELDARIRSLGAALGAAMFAVHPQRVEVVAWASCQPYLPCAGFSLLALLAYLRARTRGPQIPMLVACGLFQTAALLFKATAIPVPLLYLIVDAYPLGRLSRSPRGIAWLEKLPFVALSVAFAVGAFVARRETEFGEDRRTPATRIAQAVDAVEYYLLKMVAPVRLTPLPPMSDEASLESPRFLLKTAAILGCALLLIGLRRRWPALLAVCCAYVLLLGPNAGLVKRGMGSLADRYTYVSTIGFFVLAGAGLARLGAATRSRLLAVASTGLALLVIAALATLTWRQCQVWRDSRTLWAHAAQVSAAAVRDEPRSPEARFNLGIVLARCPLPSEAAAEFREAIRLAPGMAAAHAELGLALADTGNLPEAVAEASEAVRLERNTADFRGTRARILVQQGRLADAEAEFREATRLEPANPYWHAGLGLVLERQGRFAEAAAELGEATRLNPDIHVIGNHLQRMGQPR